MSWNHVWTGLQWMASTTWYWANGMVTRPRPGAFAWTVLVMVVLMAMTIVGG